MLATKKKKKNNFSIKNKIWWRNRSKKNKKQKTQLASWSGLLKKSWIRKTMQEVLPYLKAFLECLIHFLPPPLHIMAKFTSLTRAVRPVLASKASKKEATRSQNMRTFSVWLGMSLVFFESYSVNRGTTKFMYQMASSKDGWANFYVKAWKKNIENLSFCAK